MSVYTGPGRVMYFPFLPGNNKTNIMQFMTLRGRRKPNITNKLDEKITCKYPTWLQNYPALINSQKYLQLGKNDFKNKIWPHIYQESENQTLVKTVPQSRINNPKIISVTGSDHVTKLSAGKKSTSADRKISQKRTWIYWSVM